MNIAASVENTKALERHRTNRCNNSFSYNITAFKITIKFMFQIINKHIFQRHLDEVKNKSFNCNVTFPITMKSSKFLCCNDIQ